MTEESDIRNFISEDVSKIPKIGELIKINYCIIHPESESGPKTNKRVINSVFQEGIELLIQFPLEVLEDKIEKELSQYKPQFDFFCTRGREFITTIKEDDALISIAAKADQSEEEIEEIVAQAKKSERFDKGDIPFFSGKELKEFPPEINGYSTAFVSLSKDSNLLIENKETPGYELTYYNPSEDRNVTLAKYKYEASKEDLNPEKEKEIEDRTFLFGKTTFGGQYVATIEDENLLASITTENGDGETLTKILKEFLKGR